MEPGRLDFIKTRKGESRTAVKRAPEKKQNQESPFFFWVPTYKKQTIYVVLETDNMAFFTSAITTLQVLVTALGAGLGVWGVINLLEGYGNDNPGANAQVS